jgi:tetratricopeptide (TPR) repeat protein
MSLLLDALKKAAEQKLQKSRPEASEQISPDETLIRADADDVIGFDESSAGSDRIDETELDHSEIRSRLENDLSQRIAGDETGLDIPDVTESRTVSAPSEQGGDEETGLDITEAAETVSRPVAAENVTADDTGLDIPDVIEARMESGRAEAADDTGLDIAEVTDSRAAELSEQMLSGDDQTIYFEGEDVTDFADEDEAVTVLAPAEDETDFSQPAATVNDIETALPQKGREPEEKTEGEEREDDQDLSLLLVEQTDSNLNAGLTDGDLPPDVEQRAGGSDLADLALVDTTGGDISAEQTNTESTAITSPTQAIGSADETRRGPSAITQSTLTRAEATSTRTYAPDNYDRTLMPPRDDDASRIFSGMKSDSDVVMTPDYAKKVFRSKTSAQRVQYYKAYGAIALVILLAISFFGANEYQDESFEIDASLRPLKRDPMPGVIKTEKPKTLELFAATDAESNARTIKIIETAGEETMATEAPVVVEQVAGVETGGVEVEVQETPPTLVQAESTPEEAQQIEVVEAEPVEVASSLSSALPEVEATDSRDNLHIKIGSQVNDTDIWLQQAYSAYQAGNYTQAMKLYNRVLEVDPNNRNALLARAAINIHDGYTEAAIRDYRKLLLANPKDTLALSSLLTVASFSPEDTETQLKLMIRNEPNSPYLNFALANAYGAQNRWTEAQGYYFRALQNNPEDPNYAYNLAVSLEHISQPASAITYYRLALENFESGLATFNRDLVDERLQLLGNL